MTVRDDVGAAIRQKNMPGILSVMFRDNPPAVQSGFKVETDLWDFKADCPRTGRASSEGAWAEIAKDVLAFHNNTGGIIFFGIADDFEFVGAGPRLDSKMFNDRIRRYLPDTIWVEYSREFIQASQRYLGCALIPPRGPMPALFRADAPTVNGKKAFVAGGAARRDNDSTHVLSPEAARRWIRSLRIPVLGQTYAVQEPCFRILSPEYNHFVLRQVCATVERSLQDPRIAVTSLVGIGGMGKTAIATWAVTRAYEDSRFEFVVSMTAKDRELTAAGIVGMKQRLSSFESLLDEILDVTGFTEEKASDTQQKEAAVRELMQGSNGLLYVDNLETVDDARIIEFLDSLPVGVKAIVTSRRSKVRVAAQPIEIPPMSESEAVELVRSLERLPAYGHIRGLSDSEIQQISVAWDGIPLAIKWSLSKSKSPAEALLEARGAQEQGLVDDELLEFSFRRVFDSLTAEETAVLHTLGAIQQPLPIEAVVVGSGLAESKVLDVNECLEQDAIVLRIFDESRNDYTYTILPTTRAFVERQMQSEPRIAEAIRKNLSDWYEAREISDPDQRLIVQEIRQGRSDSDSALVDLAYGAERRGDFETAEHLYEDALRRVPLSWRAARLYGEFKRHKRSDKTGALRMYSRAAANAPSRGPDRALIFREYAMLLKDSGEADGPARAEEKLRISLAETPNDHIALSVLAQLLWRRGAYRPVVDLLQPHVDDRAPRFRERALPLLLKAYDELNEIGRAADLRRTLRNEGLLVG